MLVLGAEIEHGFSLRFVRVSRDLDTRVDQVSRAAEGQQHHYSVRADRFAELYRVWSFHSIDRFAITGSSSLPRTLAASARSSSAWRRGGQMSS